MARIGWPALETTSRPFCVLKTSSVPLAFSRNDPPLYAPACGNWVG